MVIVLSKTFRKPYTPAIILTIFQFIIFNNSEREQNIKKTIEMKNNSYWLSYIVQIRQI